MKKKFAVIREIISDKAQLKYRDEMEAKNKGHDSLAAQHNAFREGLYFVERLLCLLEPTE